MKRYVLIAGLLVLFALAVGCFSDDGTGENELSTPTEVPLELDDSGTPVDCAASLRAGCQVTLINFSGDSVPIREAPSTTSGIIGPARNSTMAVILSGPTDVEGRTWYEIQTSEISGFTEARFLFP